MNEHSQAIPVDAAFFEDIIDGYFPLQESLRQMLVRNGFASACITLTHVPIMDIPGLAAEAPVPLRLAQGTAGIADRLDIIVTLDGSAPKVSGTGKWRWYADSRAQEKLLSPLTRLAEPAIIQGIGLRNGSTDTQCFGQIAALRTSEFVIYRGQGADLRQTSDVVLWAKNSQSNVIHNGANLHLHGLFKTPGSEFEQHLAQRQASQLPGPEFTEILVLSNASRYVGL